ncbi:DENN domain-containing protein 1B isoform X2 [Betta splendens]|uniref:DENN domain-containing protein 1B isoform X2 n=1 Tax=Betta splendens TaxID=158456 RepID=A0A9W2XT81_BETSP|nr:DENN domain-containing protein 1B isoform X2 [Betta splendens]
MGSRLKQNPERTFYWFFEATCPVARDKDPDVVFQFPEDFGDEESRLTLPRFCFPYDVQRLMEGVAVQHFTFVLTDLEGCQRFGFCRLTKNTHTCLCILSYLPWFEVFYKLLNNLADYLTKGQTNEMKTLLSALYKQSVPPASGSVTLQMLLVRVSHPAGHPEGQQRVPYFIAPDPRSLPSIPENRNLTELIVAVDVGNLLQLYASMLFERRILIFASKLSSLTACVHALSAVLYPMYWQHIFIPVLPPHLLDYCCAPMPYLIGVHTSLSERVRSRGLEEVVILNVDTNTLETPFDDLKRIPSDVMSELKVCLKRQAVSPGSGVSRAFLKAQALLFGGYKDALQGQKEGEISFSEELFLNHKSPSMRHFLQSAIHLQFFKQFIDGRLDIMNKGKKPDDLFEEEILNFETTAARGKSYQQLVGNLKKGGGALIFNMKSKANIKAKSLAKTGLKNLLIPKAHSEEHKLHRGGSVSHRRAQSDCLQNRLPIMQHFGMSRPRRPLHKNSASRNKDNSDTGDDGAVSEPATEPDSDFQKDEEEEDEEEPGLCDPEEMDLLGEIFDTLSSRSSQDRGLLYSTRSLDLFGPDSHDFIAKRGPRNPNQDSLSLSINDSGSLHSWNLETTEELSDLEEDFDGLCLDNSLPEEEGTESLVAVCEMTEQEEGQREHRGNQEEVEIERHEIQAQETDERNFTEIKSEEEEEYEDKEQRRGSLEEQVAEIEMQEAGLEEMKENDKNQIEEAAKDEELEINEMHKELTGAEEEKDNNMVPENISHSEEHEQEDTPSPESTDTPEVAADTEPSAEKKSEELIKIKEQNVRQTPTPPKVRSAVAFLQSQGSLQGFQVNSRTRAVVEPGKPCNTQWSWGNTPTHSSQALNIAEENNHSDVQEENRPPVKVSELKKKFEA